MIFFYRKTHVLIFRPEYFPTKDRFLWEPSEPMHRIDTIKRNDWPWPRRLDDKINTLQDEISRLSSSLIRKINCFLLKSANCFSDLLLKTFCRFYILSFHQSFCLFSVQYIVCTFYILFSIVICNSLVYYQGISKYFLNVLIAQYTIPHWNCVPIWDTIWICRRKILFTSDFWQKFRQIDGNFVNLPYLHQQNLQP